MDQEITDKNLKKIEIAERKEERVRQDEIRIRKHKAAADVSSTITSAPDKGNYSTDSSENEVENVDETEEMMKRAWKRSERHKQAKLDTNDNFINKNNLMKIVETSERAGLSSDMACQIINDVSASVGAISETNQKNV